MTSSPVASDAVDDAGVAEQRVREGRLDEADVAEVDEQRLDALPQAGVGGAERQVGARRAVLQVRAHALVEVVTVRKQL